MESSRSSFLKPTTMFFHSQQQLPDRDWESCFSLKAAEVYVIITKRKADASAMPIACKLLIEIAKNCGDLGGADQKQNPNSGVKENTGGPTIKTSGVQGGGGSLEQSIPISMLRSLPETAMKAIDAVYLIVCVLHDLMTVKFPSREKLEIQYASAPRHEAISDVVKLGNQLPLSLLETTVQRFPNALQKALDSLTPKINADVKDFKLSFDGSSFHRAVDLFCWYYSPFYSKPPGEKDDKKALFSGKKNLLDCLYASLVDTVPSGAVGDAIRRPATRLPRATQLVKSGHALGMATGGKVKAQFLKSTTLQLPAMVFDRKLETVVMNLLEWERSKMEERPVARYLVLLGDLVGDEGDVKVLKGAGALQGRWKSEREVVEFLRRVQGSASCPSAYPAIDDEVEKMMTAPDVKAGWLAERTRPAKLASVAVLVSLIVAAIVVKRRME